MLDTPSVFDSLALDDTDRRVAQRRALALAHTRVENRMGSFLRGATSEEEFEERLALVLGEFEGAVNSASAETGYDKPEHVASSIKQHYAAAVNFEEVPAEEDQEDDESPSKASAVDSDSTPRTASQKVGEWLLTPHTSDKHHMDGVTDKEDRQYEHIKENYEENGKDEDWAKEMAARTVNKEKSSSFLADGWTVQAYVGDMPSDYQQQQPMSVPAVTGQPPMDPSDPRYQQWLLQQQQQVPGQSGHMAADGHGNTGLGGPENPIDKSHSGPGKPDVPGYGLKRKDVIEPIVPKNRTENDLKEIGEDLDGNYRQVTEDLPAASGDDAGFSTETPGGKGDHTKVFPKGDQTSPVTHETMSSSEFPSHDVVQSALTRL